MSLLIGRITIDDPETWPEPMGEATSRVGGVPTPGARNGVTLSPSLVLDPETGSSRATRITTRRQMRSLLNNPLARLQGVWVEWDEDDEQSGWYVPSQATVDLAQNALASAYFKTSGFGLELVGRPRSHRRAVLARIRDLRSSTEPKDTLRRLYGVAFDGSGSVGSAVTPAARVYLPSTATDVVAHSGGTPTLGTAIAGRSSASIIPVTGLSDYAVVSMEQAAAARILGDVIVYDRRSDVAAVTTTGPTAGWEEVYGRDWPWSGLSVLDNYVARVYMTTSETFALEYWNGSAYAEYAVVTLKARVSATDYALDTVLSTNVYEWTPERAVLHLRMSRAAQSGTTCDVYVTLQRGWLGPRIEIYPASGQVAKISVDPTGAISANNFPTSFTANVNYGSLTATHGVPMAVVQYAATSATVGSAVETAGTGYVSLHLSRCATGDVATARAALGQDVLSGCTYPQSIVPR